MTLALFTTFFTSTIKAEVCYFKKTPQVHSESLTKDYNSKGELVSFHPILKDFREYFPKKVKLTGLLAGSCQDFHVTVDVYHKEGPKQVHDHDKHGDHKRLETPKKASEEAKYRKKPSFTQKGTIDTSNKSFEITHIPHLKFYEKLKPKLWLHQVKYIVSIRNKKGAIMKKKVLTLDSPMSD